MTRVLIVEDNPANMKLARDLLVREGFDVLMADTADAGIALARDQQPDLVLMDIQLPGTDGLTAARILRSGATTRVIPLIALTAHAMRGDERRMLDAGFDSYVAKPIRYKQLLATVRRVLGAGS